uniref:NADH-ubiquinone oxidoreductase chain 6 n=1 Tax=Anolis punctatus TaxID=174263 RepID=A0A513X1C4_ANOPN|nr:NADH dehydrogenase subunit 6 [Anolis punctatus]QDH07724.1 NADH dehydrogenase subunit 6 [Anolis punctatus]
MVYFLFILFFCLVLGFIVIASNPSPYYGAVGLIMSAAFGCGVLIEFGGSLVSLVLFLVYLGGMLVVFAYSVALASDLYPDGLGDWSVSLYSVGYFILVVLLWKFVGGGSLFSVYGMGGGEAMGLFVVREDFGGVSLMYGVGGFGLLLCGWGLLLTLFVVLELTRGVYRGSLRAV